MKIIICILALPAVYFYGCDSPADLNRAGDKLSGYVTHVDTNLNLNGGFYSISLFNADSTNPFYRVPVRTDSIKLIRRDNLYESLYDMQGIPDGRYYIAATWSKYPRVEGEVPIVLGTYGCDTSHNCTGHQIVAYPNTEGLFRNITSWTDLSKRLF